MSDLLLDHVPPHNLDAEMAVISAAMQDHNAWTLASQHLDSAAFFRPANGVIWGIVSAMRDKNPVFDSVALEEELKKAGQYEVVGGRDYIVDLIGSAPTYANAEYYATVVRDKARLRGLINAGAELIREAHNADAEPDAIIDQCEKAVMALTQQDRASMARPVGPVLAELGELLASGGCLPWGLRTPFADLDDKTHGFRPGNLIIVASRPSIGKSAMLLNLADGMARMGESVGFFSLEMCMDEIAPRLLAASAEVDLWSLLKGRISDADSAKIRMSIDASRTLSFVIDDAPALRMTEIRARARRMVLNHGVKIIFVDYLQLVRGERQRNDNREQEVASVSRGLKALARELQIPVVAACQVNRALEDGERPGLRHLRESGAIEQDADLVTFLHKPDKNNPNVVEFIIGKQRNGPTGIVNFTWSPAFTKFRPGQKTNMAVVEQGLINDEPKPEVEPIPY